MPPSENGNDPKILVKSVIHQLWPELTFEYSRSSGAGGQNVNKVSSKVGLRWRPYESEVLPRVLGMEKTPSLLAKIRRNMTVEDEILITCDEFRDQPRNKARCLEKLEALIERALTPEKKRIKTKPTKSSKRKRLESKKVHKEKKIQRQKVNWS